MRFMSFVMLISVINLQITRSVYCGPVLYSTTRDGCHALLWPFTMLPILLIQLYIVCHPRTKNAQYGVHGSFSPVMPCHAMQDKWDAMKSPHEQGKIMNTILPKPNKGR